MLDPSTIKETKIASLVVTLMGEETIVLSNMSQIQKKITGCMILHECGV